MGFSALDRKDLVFPITVFAGFLSAAGSETTKDQIAIFIAPWSGVIRGFQGCYTDEAGTTPAIDLTLERAGTVLATLPTLTTNETGQRVKDLAIRISEGDIIQVLGAVVNTDNAFDGFLVIVEAQPLVDL